VKGPPLGSLDSPAGVSLPIAGTSYYRWEYGVCFFPPDFYGNFDFLIEIFFICTPHREVRVRLGGFFPIDVTTLIESNRVYHRTTEQHIFMKHYSQCGTRGMRGMRSNESLFHQSVHRFTRHQYKAVLSSTREGVTFLSSLPSSALLGNESHFSHRSHHQLY